MSPREASQTAVWKDASGAGINVKEVPEGEPAYDPSPPGSPAFMAFNGSLLGAKEKGGQMVALDAVSREEAKKQMDQEVKKEVGADQNKDKYPPPDHDEPLKPHEVKNIAMGYALGFVVLALAIALDESTTGYTGDLSDWAQRLKCEGCDRHPDCFDGTQVNLTYNGTVDYIDCPTNVANWFMWVGTVGAVGFNCLISYFAGRLHLGNPTFWKVSYTRKISHFTMFMMQIVVRFVSLGEEHHVETVSTLVGTSTLYMMLYHAVLLKPIRKRSVIAQTIFVSLDRPADRPYTLRWLTTQNIVYYIVFVPLMYCLIAQDKFALWFIPTLIVGLGDGLAEPVGVTWGKHKYRARAIWYKKQCCAGDFVRSYEGSACVFIVSVIAVAIMKYELTWAQWGVMIAILPPLMTISEAFSPHTWDTPFLFGTGGIVIFCCTLIDK